LGDVEAILLQQTHQIGLATHGACAEVAQDAGAAVGLVAVSVHNYSKFMHIFSIVNVE
jgi:hypothetical protein